jgi:xylulokinase
MAAHSNGGLFRNQIAKIASKHNEVYRNTERISLVSSFMASLFIGAYAPIDFSDASGMLYYVSRAHALAGMNLLDIHTHTWSPEILTVSPAQLAEKLGEPAPSYSVAGRVSAYFAKRYGFRDDCKVCCSASEVSP